MKIVKSVILSVAILAGTTDVSKADCYGYYQPSPGIQLITAMLPIVASYAMYHHDRHRTYNYNYTHTYNYNYNRRRPHRPHYRPSRPRRPHYGHRPQRPHHHRGNR